MGECKNSPVYVIIKEIVNQQIKITRKENNDVRM